MVESSCSLCVSIVPTCILRNVSIMLGYLRVFVSCACVDWQMKSLDMSAIINYFVGRVQNAFVHTGLFHFSIVFEYRELASQCNEVCSFHVAFACLASGVIPIVVFYLLDNE